MIRTMKPLFQFVGPFIATCSAALISAGVFCLVVDPGAVVAEPRLSPREVIAHTSESGTACARVEIHNPFNARLTELKLTPSCKCTLISAASTNLDEGDRTFAEVVINLNGNEGTATQLLIEYKLKGHMYGELVYITALGNK